MHKEKEEELQSHAERGRLVKQVVTHKGWTEIIRPQLEAVRADYFEKFREAKEYTEFLISQQSINAIDVLFRIIENTLITGEASHKELYRNTREDSES